MAIECSSHAGYIGLLFRETWGSDSVQGSTSLIERMEDDADCGEDRGYKEGVLHKDRSCNPVIHIILPVRVQ